MTARNNWKDGDLLMERVSITDRMKIKAALIRKRHADEIERRRKYYAERNARDAGRGIK